MRESLRDSGIDIIGDVPWGTHFCQFYQTKKDLIDVLVPYFKTGLENNELCVWITSQPLEIEEAKEAMKRAVPDIDVYLEKGQMEIIPYTQGYMKGGIFDPDRVVNSWVEKIDQVQAWGYDGLRATGDNRWLEKEGWNGFIDYENKVDAIIDKHHVIALCPYYLDMCSTAEVIDVVSNHQFALIKREGKWERIENSGRKRAEKEAIQAAKNWEYTFDSVPDLIAIIDEEYRVVRANKAMAARLGVTPEECIGLTCYRVIHGTTKPPSFCPQRQMLKDGFEHTSEVCEDCLGGYFIVSVSPLYDSEGKLTGSIHVARDINERKKVEERLKESEEKYRNIVEIANEGIGINDSEFKITYANKRMADMLGYTLEEGIGRSIWDFLSEESKAIVKLNLEKKRLGTDGGYELKFIRKDGSPIWTHMNTKPLLDKEGKYLGSVSMFTDITKRKEAEEKLRESEQKYRNIIETTNEGIVVIDSELRITYVNNRLMEKGGYSQEEVIGRFWWDFTDEEGKAAAKLHIDKRRRGIDETYELKIICKYGSSFWALVSSKSLFDNFGKFAGSLSMLTDITERKEAEEKIKSLANIVESSNDAIITESLDDIITSWNKGAEKVYGYSVEEALGRAISILEPDSLKGETKFFSEAIKQGEKIQHYETSRLKKDGTIINVSTTLSPVFDASGKLVAISTVARDITERKKAEEALKKAHENLEEKVKERTVELEKAYISLKESETGLAEAQKMAHIGNWDWDLVTDKAYWSDEMYRIFGRNPQELAPRYNEFLSYIQSDDRDYVVGSFKKGLNGSPHFIDFRISSADGEERTVHMQSEVVFDEKNNPIRIKGTVQDITERKKSEEKIRNLANIVESSQDAIITISLDGIVTSWNKGAEQVYGYSAEEILGKNVSILEPDIVKGEVKYFSEKIKHGKKVQHYETLRLKKDGNIIYISVTLSPVFNASGELVALSAIVRDVTERKRAEKALQESEARLRRFYESGMFGVFYFNLDGSITEANDKFLEIIGYTRVDLQAGRINCDKITPPEYRLLDEKCIAELKAIGMSAPYEKEYIRKDGLHVPIIIGVATFDHERHEGIAFVLDNTERKKIEKALAEMDRIRIKEIHHRIKNNLQVISSLLDLQAEKFDDEKVREAFREGQSRVVSMSLIHEELYKGKGNDTLDFSAYLRELAEKLFQTYSLNGKNISLLMDLEEDAFFDMDTAVPLGIIVNELVSNSLKHAFNEGEEGEVRIRLCREEKKNEIHESPFSLTISDNGKGIPEDIEFEKLESLGLQLVSTLVDQLDGEIEIKRAQGIEFRITFDVVEKS